MSTLIANFHIHLEKKIQILYVVGTLSVMSRARTWETIRQQSIKSAVKKGALFRYLPRILRLIDTSPICFNAHETIVRKRGWQWNSPYYNIYHCLPRFHAIVSYAFSRFGKCLLLAKSFYNSRIFWMPSFCPFKVSSCVLSAMPCCLLHDWLT